MSKTNEKCRKAFNYAAGVMLEEVVPYALGRMERKKLRQLPVALDTVFQPTMVDLIVGADCQCSVKVELCVTVTREEVTA